MLQNNDEWLCWEQDGKRCVVNLDQIAGAQLSPRTENCPTYVELLVVGGGHFTMSGELADQFMSWYWRTKGTGGYKVPDLDML